MIKDRPCKITELSSSKPGKHGHAKVNIVAVDIFTDKKYEDCCPSSHNLNVPNVDRKEYTLLGIEDGFLSLMDENGNTKDDLKLPTEVDPDLAKLIQKLFEEGKCLLIGTIAACEFEMAISVKEDTSGFYFNLISQ